MASSSGSWFIFLVILIIGAVLLVAANESNHGFLSSVNNRIGSDLQKQGGEIVDSFVDRFSSKTTQPQKPPAVTGENKAKIKPSQKDDLGFKDRAQLDDLLDSVGK